MIDNIKDDDIVGAVIRAQSEIHPSGSPVEDADHFISIVSQISTRATLDLLGVEMGNNTQEVVAGMPLKQTFREWADQFTLKTHFDRFLAIMVYLWEKENRGTFVTTDITRMYDKARWKKPANMADVFAKGADRIFFAEADEVSVDGQKLWQMTRTGYEHLMNLQVEV